MGFGIWGGQKGLGGIGIEFQRMNPNHIPQISFDCLCRCLSLVEKIYFQKRGSILEAEKWSDKWDTDE